MPGGRAVVRDVHAIGAGRERRDRAGQFERRAAGDGGGDAGADRSGARGRLESQRARAADGHRAGRAERRSAVDLQHAAPADANAELALLVNVPLNEPLDPPAKTAVVLTMLNVPPPLLVTSPVKIAGL